MEQLQKSILDLEEILPQRKQLLSVFFCKWQQVINLLISHVIYLVDLVILHRQLFREPSSSVNFPNYISSKYRSAKSSVFPLARHQWELLRLVIAIQSLWKIWVIQMSLQFFLWLLRLTQHHRTIHCQSQHGFLFLDPTPKTLKYQLQSFFVTSNSRVFFWPIFFSFM